MWILDSSYRKSVQLWIKEERIKRISERYSPFFYLHLPDPHFYGDMLESLESKFEMKECDFKTIYGRLEGYRVHAGRKVAALIEKQTRFAAKLYNVDVRLDQRFMAERGMFPCGYPEESRFTADFEIPLSSLEIKIKGNPYLDDKLSSIELHNGQMERLEGREVIILSDLFSLIETIDPDLILFPNADHWMPLILKKAGEYGLDQTMSRSGRFRKLASRSYWSYGKVEHKAEAIIPEGRILIDTESSFTYRIGGVKGVLLASRLTGLSPNLTSRFTPGTLISSYEVYEAIRRGIAVPFRKDNPERLRSFVELRSADKGGMIFQPEPGVYEQAYQIDFTSMYPSIIVKYNLSPEIRDGEEKRGFLPELLEPLLELRLKTKRLRKRSAECSQLDNVLKWMLITCFGYTGYRNAKFGSIEIHERITSIAREILVRTKEIAESMDFKVLHGIVDCLWLRGNPISTLKERVEEEIGIYTEIEAYDWLVFLPMQDGGGAYNRYYGRLADGSIKFRGCIAKRGDAPEYITQMQLDMLEVMREAKNRAELGELESGVRRIYEEHVEGLRSADPRKLVINRRISKLDYARRCAEASATNAFRKLGIAIAPGMMLGYVIRDAKRWIVDPEWNANEFDAKYYGKLLEKAWREIAFAFDRSHYI